MLDTVGTALIGAGATVAGATIPYLLTTYSGGRRGFLSRRSDAIPGVWTGEGTDFYAEKDQPFYNFDLRLTFRKRGRRVEGKGELLVPAHPAVPVVLQGGFFDNNYLQFNYRSQDVTRNQMGVIVFRLEGDGKTLAGHYAGLSPTRGVFVVGNVSLTRISSAAS